MIDLSIIIVSYNTKDYLEQCLKNLLLVTEDLSSEIFVVDNVSTDGSPEMVEKKFPQVKLIKSSKNVGFGAGNNLALKKAKGRYLLLLNSDIEIRDQKLFSKMIQWMDGHPKVGVSTCALLNPDGSIQGSGGYFPTLGRIFSWMFFLDDIPVLDKLIKPYHPVHPWSPVYTGQSFYRNERKIDWVTGAFFLVREEAIREAGYFDEKYFMYVEELDLSYQITKRGWEIWYLPQFSIIHYGQASSSSEFATTQEFKGLKIYFAKNLPKWQFPWLRLCLKSGALLRIIVLGLLKGGKTARTYVKAFEVA
jgi:GT2 family glycosyltransferase